VLTVPAPAVPRTKDLRAWHDRGFLRRAVVLGCLFSGELLHVQSRHHRGRATERDFLVLVAELQRCERTASGGSHPGAVLETSVVIQHVFLAGC